MLSASRVENCRRSESRATLDRVFMEAPPNSNYIISMRTHAPKG